MSVGHASRGAALIACLLILVACVARPLLYPLPQATPVDPPIAATPVPTASPAAVPSVGEAPRRPASGERAEVLRVVDGDTLLVRLNGRSVRVRYIGIDAPESVRPDSPVESMGPEAAQANKELVDGRRVLLERDVSDTDRHGRLLRYVWVGDMMVNGELVRRGYAQAITYPPDVKYQSWLRQLETEAREQQRGLWADR